MLKTNSFDCMMRSTRKMPKMMQDQNFDLSRMKKCHPLQELFDNFNNVVVGMSLYLQCNEYYCEYSTKTKVNLGDKSRRKCFGHVLQLQFASLCFKNPHFKFCIWLGSRFQDSSMIALM